jgi:hypothetical protein
VFFLLLAHLTLNQSVLARDMRGRLGVGMSNQYVNGIPAVSFKLQKSRAFGIGALVAMELDDNEGGHGAGIKFFRNIFDEPQLHFYSAALFALVADKVNSVDNSGFQVDLTLGSEFNFVGLESLGFSFEFGISFNNVYDRSVIRTAGYHFVTAGIHFYL